MPIRKRMNFGTSKKSALGRAALTKQVIQIDDALPSNDDSHLPAAKRLHHNVLATALANKLARIAWTVLAQRRNYEARVMGSARARI